MEYLSFKERKTARFYERVLFWNTAPKPYLSQFVVKLLNFLLLQLNFKGHFQTSVVLRSNIVYLIGYLAQVCPTFNIC